MRLDRRSFLIAVGAAGAGSVCPSVLAANTVSRKPKACGPAQGVWIPTACQGCTQYCAIEVFNQNGRATRVRGNRYSTRVSD